MLLVSEIMRIRLVVSRFHLWNSGISSLYSLMYCLCSISLSIIRQTCE